MAETPRINHKKVKKVRKAQFLLGKVESYLDPRRVTDWLHSKDKESRKLKKALQQTADAEKAKKFHADLEQVKLDVAFFRETFPIVMETVRTVNQVQMRHEDPFKFLEQVSRARDNQAMELAKQRAEATGQSKQQKPKSKQRELKSKQRELKSKSKQRELKSKVKPKHQTKPKQEKPKHQTKQQAQPAEPTQTVTRTASVDMDLLCEEDQPHDLMSVPRTPQLARSFSDSSSSESVSD